jgi:hypothetical protein
LKKFARETIEAEISDNMNLPLLHAPNAVKPAYDTFINFLRNRIYEGATFSDGVLIQFSWLCLKVEESEGQRRIISPEFGVTPMNFIDDCSDSLNLVLTQKYMVESFGAEFGWCNCRQSAIVIKDFDGCRDIFMNRLNEEGNSDSGWFFSAQDSKLEVDDASNLERRSLWELFCRRPFCGDFFLLPPGWQVMFEDKPVVLTDYLPATYDNDSYYAQKYMR